MKAVFPLFYAGNAQYFSALKQHKSVIIDLGERFEKQTFRNRCMISTANGTQQLVVPVVREGKPLMKDVKISYAEKWQQAHWRALTSAYKSSPYFEFYEDYFRPFYENQIETLEDLNKGILNLFISKMDLDVEVSFSEEYVNYPEDDFRNQFSKKEYEQHQNERHYQVFDDKHGFLNNLSVFDLLFNLGPESKLFL